MKSCMLYLDGISLISKMGTGEERGAQGKCAWVENYSFVFLNANR